MHQNEINSLASKHGFAPSEQKGNSSKRMRFDLTRDILGSDLYYQALLFYEEQGGDVETFLGLYGKRRIESFGEKNYPNIASAMADISDRIKTFETDLRSNTRAESATVEQMLRNRFMKDRVPVCIREGSNLSGDCAHFWVSPVGVASFSLADFGMKLSAIEFCKHNRLAVQPYELLGVSNVVHPYHKVTLADAVQIVNNTRNLVKAAPAKTITEAYADMQDLFTRVNHTWITGRASLELLKSAALCVPIAEVATV